MNSNKMLVGAVTLSIMLTSACSPSSKKCGSFPATYERNNAELLKMKKIPLDIPTIKKAIEKIQECYPSHSYQSLDNKIEIVEARTDNGGYYYVISELYGVDDLRIIFKANADGVVLGSYQASML